VGTNTQARATATSVNTRSSIFKAGYAAYGEGKSWSDAPYPIGAFGRIDWLGGWISARTDKALAVTIAAYGPIVAE
jgi:ribosome modulation factor